MTKKEDGPEESGGGGVIMADIDRFISRGNTAAAERRTPFMNGFWCWS